MGQKMRFTGLLLRDALIGAVVGSLAGRVIASLASANTELGGWLGGVVGAVLYVGFQLRVSTKHARDRQTALSLSGDAPEQEVEAGELPGELTWRQAEEWVLREVQIRFDEPTARLTQASRDGGADVVSERAVVEVKHHAAPVGVKDVRALHGVAMTSPRRVGVFFARNGYTPDAREFAARAGVLLFTYDAPSRSVSAANGAAHRAVEQRSFVLAQE